jgi:4-aminobutyrate aminotransferase-like enzyme
MTSKATNQELQQRKNAATPRGVGVMCDFYAERASNAELWDVEGRRFIDFAAGIAVLNTGHRHPKLLDAMRAQMENSPTPPTRSCPTPATWNWPSASTR